jgi:hypothetical protein
MKLEVNVAGLEGLIAAIDRLSTKLTALECLNGPTKATDCCVEAPKAVEPVITPEPSRDPETGSLDASAEAESIAEAVAVVQEPTAAPSVELDTQDTSSANCIKVLSAVGAKVGRKPVKEAIEASTGKSALGDVHPDQLEDMLKAVVRLING